MSIPPYNPAAMATIETRIHDEQLEGNDAGAERKTAEQIAKTLRSTLNALHKALASGDLSKHEEKKALLGEQRDALQEALTEEHGGDDDAAMEDTRFDALFAGAADALKAKEEVVRKFPQVDARKVRRGAGFRGGY